MRDFYCPPHTSAFELLARMEPAVQHSRGTRNASMQYPERLPRSLRRAAVSYDFARMGQMNFGKNRPLSLLSLLLLFISRYLHTDRFCVQYFTRCSIQSAQNKFLLPVARRRSILGGGLNLSNLLPRVTRDKLSQYSFFLIHIGISMIYIHLD